MKRVLFIAILLCGGFIPRLSAGEQYAFLVGIGGYDEKQLRGLGEFPRADVIEFRDTLLASGFKPENVILMVDDLSALPKTGPAGRYLPEAEKICKELQLLLPALERDDTLIVALAGHGVQFKGESEPFFCPLDARLDDKKTLLSLAWLYDQLNYDEKTGTGCKPRQKLLLVDACRNDPASRLLRDSGGPALESVSIPQAVPLPEGIVALFSCAEGQQALQHDPLKHGIFFYHLLEGWKGGADGDKDGEITLDEIIAYTKSRTQTYARLELGAPQTPRQKGYFDGTWILRSVEKQSQLLTNSIGMKLVSIPAGEFLMGSPDSDHMAHSHEKPQHRVRITQSFSLGQTEVTQSQWKSVMGTEPWKDEDDAQKGVDYPATSVTWDDASEFCRKLSAKEGKSYRLPTEAEWEYACRGGTQTRYSFGDDESQLSDHGWFSGNADDVNEKYPHRVGQKKANPFGLYDMHGNVEEWCNDWYVFEENYYKQSRVDDPNGPLEGVGRVQRGGSWYLPAEYCRSASRSANTQGAYFSYQGFRVVLSPSGK